jgi:hypothetical protein
VLSDRGDRDGIGDIGLAGVAGSQEAGSCGQLGRDIEDGLPGGDERLGDAAAEPVGALDSPLAIGPLRCPGEQRSRSVLVHHQSDRLV